MKRKWFSTRLLVLLTALWSAPILYCAPDEPLAVRNTLKEANAVISENPPTDADFQSGIRIVTAGLKKYPANRRLLKKRANLYLNVHEYSHAKRDLDDMADSAPLAAELSLIRCMLEEKLNGLTGVAEQCYENVVAMYESRHDTPEAPGANYVVAALLADSPDAEKLRADYVNAAATDPAMRGFIEQFSRERYLQQVLP